MIKISILIMTVAILTGCSQKNTEKVCSSDGYMYEISPDTKKIIRVEDKFAKCKGWEIF